MSPKPKRPMVSIRVTDYDTSEALQIDAKSAEALWEWLISTWPQSTNKLDQNCTMKVWVDATGWD